jgi:hypothetical protein
MSVTEAMVASIWRRHHNRLREAQNVLSVCKHPTD